MSNTITVVGCGSIGRRHARNLHKHGGVSLLLVDADNARAKSLATEIGGCAYANLGDALEKGPDAVFICTPTDRHCEEALAAAKAGCDLFIEKPLAHRLNGVQELERVVLSKNLIAMVGCNMRFHPGPAAIKAALDRRSVGNALSVRVHTGSYLPSWRPLEDFRFSYSASRASGGAVLDCIHEIDLAQWYLGPAQLRAALVQPASSLGLETDGLAELLLVHDGGRISSVHLNFIQRDYSRSCLVIGSDGTLEWSWRDAEVRTFDAEGNLASREPHPADWDLNQMYVDELRHFLAARAARQQPMNGISEAARTLGIALQARSQRSTSSEVPAS